MNLQTEVALFEIVQGDYAGCWARISETHFEIVQPIDPAPYRTTSAGDMVSLSVKIILFVVAFFVAIPLMMRYLGMMEAINVAVFAFIIFAVIGISNVVREFNATQKWEKSPVRWKTILRLPIQSTFSSAKTRVISYTAHRSSEVQSRYKSMLKWGTIGSLLNKGLLAAPLGFAYLTFGKPGGKTGPCMFAELIDGSNLVIAGLDDATRHAVESRCLNLSVDEKKIAQAVLRDPAKAITAINEELASSEEQVTAAGLNKLLQEDKSASRRRFLHAMQYLCQNAISEANPNFRGNPFDIVPER